MEDPGPKGRVVKGRDHEEGRKGGGAFAKVCGPGGAGRALQPGAHPLAGTSGLIRCVTFSGLFPGSRAATIGWAGRSETGSGPSGHRWKPTLRGLLGPPVAHFAPGHGLSPRGWTSGRAFSALAGLCPHGSGQPDG